MSGIEASLFAFLRSQLSPSPPRVRAFLRLEIGLLFASFVVVTFKPVDGYWTVAYLLLVSLPTVANSLSNAIQRVYASVIGSGLAVLIVVVAYDQSWLYVPLQAAIMGVALFVARSTPIGPTALTGGATFAIVTGSDVSHHPERLITLAFYRILQAAIGGAIGGVAQRAFWPDDPLDVLKLSLSSQLLEVEACLRGEQVALDPARVGRHFELLANAQAVHPELVRRRSELGKLILDVACVVDTTLRTHAQPGPHPSEALLEEARSAERRVETAALYEPPEPPPPAPPLKALPEIRWPALRGAIKLALAAFLGITLADLLGFVPSGALIAALTMSFEVSSGTSIVKPIVLFSGLLMAIAVVFLVVTPWMPNIEAPGSLLVLAAVAFAPTAWLLVSGPRMRNTGVFATVIVSVALFQGFRPSVGLEAPARFAVSLAIGGIAIFVVDRLLWPVDARQGMRERAALLMRDAAALYRESDPRVVLAADRGARWSAHRNLVVLVQLRSESVPLPGTPAYEPEEEALRIANATQNRIIERIDDARREIAAGAPLAGASEARERVAAELLAEAARLEDRNRRTAHAFG